MRATLAFNGLNKQLIFNCFNEFTQYKDIQPMRMSVFCLPVNKLVTRNPLEKKENKTDDISYIWHRNRQNK